jgi:aminomethyltransferase
MIKEQEYLLVVNASNIEKDWNWISSHNSKGVEMLNVSDDWSLLAVQGPKAIDVLQKLTDVDLSEIKYYHFNKGVFAGVDDVIVSATGYTGSGGFELYVPNSVAKKVWNSLFEAGKPYNIKPIGLAARDTLRLEMGFCLYGNDINDKTSPLEAGLGWITKFSKDFINSDELKNQKEAGVSKKLIGFEMVDRGIPRNGYQINNADGIAIGHVTSGTMGPSVKKAIGLGYVNIDYVSENQDIFLEIRNKQVAAKVVKFPFYKA